MDEIYQKLKQYIIDEFLSEYGENTLDPNRPLVEDGIVDSLGIILITSFIEEQFGIVLQPEEIVLDNFETLRTISELVNQKRVGNPN